MVVASPIVAGADASALVLRHLPEVRRLAAVTRRRCQLHAWFPFDDLISDGHVALCRAVQSYDPARGPLVYWVRLHVYAAMIDCVRANRRHYGRQHTCDFSRTRLDKNERVDLRASGLP